MRRITLLTVFLLLLSIPTLAGAQSSAPVLDELIIQVWPEYDQPAVLVIYDFRVAQTALPVTLKIRVPKDGNIFAVAQSTSEGLMNVPYEPPVGEGDYDVLTLTLTESSIYRVEYYAPLVRSGIKRSYTLDWPGDYAVDYLQVFVQKPIGARNLTTQPGLPELPGLDGFVYAQGEFNNLPTGRPFSISFEYEKDDNTLSIANQTVSLTGALETAQGSTFSLTSSLPWLLGGLGVVLIVGGVFWFWKSGRAQKGGSDSTRRRHAARSQNDVSEGTYCSQCGKRAEGGDRFCRACGARLRRD